MQTVIGFFRNYPLIAALAAWFTAQVLKTFIDSIVKGKLNLERMVGSGGMPSAHTATVSALVIAVARSNGVRSPLFAMCFVLASVVMYDATGVRYAVGEQAKAINRILRNAENKQEESIVDDSEIVEDIEVKEMLGHTPLQVLAGALLGIIIAIILT